MLIDIHTHTHPLSRDSALEPDELVEAAKEAGLDGICLTEHDFFWDSEKARELGRRHDFLVIPGVEVNTEHGHMLVFGLERFVFGMHRLRELAALVEAAGGAAIFGHPYRRQLPFELRHRGDWTEVLDEASANPAYQHIDAIEAYNGRGTLRQNEFSRELSGRLGLPAVAGSDAHSREDIGTCATEFDATVTGLTDLIRELKAGRFRPVVLREQPSRLR